MVPTATAGAAAAASWSTTIVRTAPSATSAAPAAVAVTTAGDPGVGEHERQPVGGEARVERHVGGAGAEDAEQIGTMWLSRSASSPTRAPGATPAATSAAVIAWRPRRSRRRVGQRAVVAWITAA